MNSALLLKNQIRISLPNNQRGTICLISSKYNNVTMHINQLNQAQAQAQAQME